MNKQLTEIIFLLDRSGSMAGLEADTIGGFNALIKKQSKLKGKTMVTAVLFDDNYELLWNGLDAKKVKLTNKEYYVRGCTALLDAVGKTISEVSYRIAQTSEMKRPAKVIFVITTDGLENASCEYNYEKVKKLIHRQQKKYCWEFMFIGANLDAIEEADSMGISSDNAFNFEASEVGVEKMYSMMEEKLLERRNR